MTVVEAELRFFQMKVEGMFGDTVELEQTAFGEAPEAFDAVDVVWSPSELVVRVADPEVPIEAEIDEAVVASPPVGVKDGFRSDSSANDSLESGFGGVRHDLGIDLIAAFEQTEDDRLATGSAASLATRTTRTKVRFVGLNLTLEWRTALTRLGHPSAHSQKDRIRGTDRDAGDRRSLRRSQIQYKTANQTPKSRFTDLGIPKILVTPNHHRRLALSSKSFAS